ncbi:MAG: S-layer protein [Candidatus Saganbacteria bacterium]|uniref:S-layer protein n=1 Tax=Candidatus Saganbacteria bacterium TaxID=2575572 RepID=A0A833L0V1_UNCSA|nr:MAG: S-layer protein [Candidatus Saganbacteria bacterium]
MRRSISFLILCLLTSLAFGISSDLSEIGVGARPLGLGKAYVGLASDASALFLNPAGLAVKPAFKFTSMTGKLLQDVNYISLGAANPLNVGMVGFAYINAGIYDIPLTTITRTATEDIITQTGVVDYSSSIFYLSYSRPLFPKMFGGVNLKLFTQSFSKTTGELDGAIGTGTDIDVGVFYKPSEAFSLGTVFQNILPSSLGGRFVWKNGSAAEGIPAVLKVGLSSKILGREGFRSYKNQEVLFLVDYENRMAEKRPAIWHFGCEWGLSNYLQIRGGIDQKYKATESGVGIDNNLTCGVGLNYKGFSFDYAYHQFGELTENATHFFSLGFIGGEEVKLSEPTKEGKAIFNPFKPENIIKSFDDVPEGYWAKEAIEYLATLGFVSGYPDNTYRPEQPLSRAELAKMLVVAKGFAITSPEGEIFSDLPLDHWAAPYVYIALSRKYISGYPDFTFKPWKTITRAEAIVIISKFAGFADPLTISENPFTDINKRHWAARWISVAKNNGLLEYLSGRDFEPEASFTRAEAAEVISKTEFAKQKIKELLKKRISL